MERNTRTSRDNYQYLTFGHTITNLSNLIELMKIAFTDENGELIPILTGIKDDTVAQSILNKFAESSLSEVTVKKRPAHVRLKEYFQEASRIGMCDVDANQNIVTPTLDFIDIYTGRDTVVNVYNRIQLQYRHSNPSTTQVKNKTQPFINLRRMCALSENDPDRVSKYPGFYISELPIIFAMKDNSDKELLLSWNLIKELRKKPGGLLKKSDDDIRWALTQMGVKCDAKSIVNNVCNTYVSFILLGDLFTIHGGHGNGIITINPKAIGKWEQLDKLYNKDTPYVPEGYFDFSPVRKKETKPQELWGYIDEHEYWNNIVHNTYIPYEKEEKDKLKLLCNFESFFNIHPDKNDTVESRWDAVNRFLAFYDRDAHLKLLQETGINCDDVLLASTNPDKIKEELNKMNAPSYANEFEIDCLMKIDAIPGMRNRLQINGHMENGIVRSHASGGSIGADGFYVSSDGKLCTVEPFNSASKEYQNKEVANAEEHAINLYKKSKDNIKEVYSILIAPTIQRTTLIGTRIVREGTIIKLIPLNVLTWLYITNNSDSEQKFLKYIESIDNIFMHESFDNYINLLKEPEQLK